MVDGAAREYGQCPKCGAILKLRRDGTMRKHTNGIYNDCEGTGTRPYAWHDGPVRNGRYDR